MTSPLSLSWANFSTPQSTAILRLPTPRKPPKSMIAARGRPSRSTTTSTSRPMSSPALLRTLLPRITSTSRGSIAAAEIPPLPPSESAGCGPAAASLERIPAAVLGADELVLGVGELVAGVGAAVLVARWAFPCARRWILALPSEARTSVSTAATAATAHRECLRMPPRSHMYTTMISVNAPGGDAVPCVAASAILRLAHVLVGEPASTSPEHALVEVRKHSQQALSEL